MDDEMVEESEMDTDTESEYESEHERAPEVSPKLLHEGLYQEHFMHLGTTMERHVDRMFSLTGHGSYSMSRNKVYSSAMLAHLAELLPYGAPCVIDTEPRFRGQPFILTLRQSSVYRATEMENNIMRLPSYHVDSPRYTRTLALQSPYGVHFGMRDSSGKLFYPSAGERIAQCMLPCAERMVATTYTKYIGSHTHTDRVSGSGGGGGGARDAVVPQIVGVTASCRRILPPGSFYSVFDITLDMVDITAYFAYGCYLSGNPFYMPPDVMDERALVTAIARVDHAAETCASHALGHGCDPWAAFALAVARVYYMRWRESMTTVYRDPVTNRVGEVATMEFHMIVNHEWMPRAVDILWRLALGVPDCRVPKMAQQMDEYGGANVEYRNSLAPVPIGMVWWFVEKLLYAYVTDATNTPHNVERVTQAKFLWYIMRHYVDAARGRRYVHDIVNHVGHLVTKQWPYPGATPVHSSE